MDKTLHYIFDPMCGWCYGASAALAAVADRAGVRLNLLPRCPDWGATPVAA